MHPIASSPFLSTIWLLTALCACASERRFAGPLPVRNQNPAQLVAPSLDPGRARPLPGGAVDLRIDAAYTSLFLSGSGNGNSLYQDGEILRTSIKTKAGLGQDLEVTAELPFAHTSGGFLDEFLIDYHDALGLPDQGRSSVPNNQWDVHARRGSTDVHRLDQANVQLLDVPLGMTWHFLPVTEERPYGLGVRGVVDVPLAHDEHGYGTGRWEFAAGLFGEADVGMFSFTGWANYAWTRQPYLARQTAFPVEDIVTFGGGVEWLASDSLSFVLQTQVENSLLENLAFREAANDQWLLWSGGRIRLSQQALLEIAVGEDLSEHTGPDVTFYLSLLLQLGK